MIWFLRQLPHVHFQPKKQAFLKSALGISLPPRPRLSVTGEANSHVSTLDIRRPLAWLIEQGPKALIERKSNAKWVLLMVSLAVVGVGYTRATDIGEWVRWLKKS